MEQQKMPRLVYISRRAYETQTIRLVLRTKDVCDKRDTGFQLLYGAETGLELINPENSLLISTERAITLEPKLRSLLEPETPPEMAAYALDEATSSFVPTKMPEDIPTQ